MQLPPKGCTDKPAFVAWQRLVCVIHNDREKDKLTDIFPSTKQWDLPCWQHLVPTQVGHGTPRYVRFLAKVMSAICQIMESLTVCMTFELGQFLIGAPHIPVLKGLAFLILLDSSNLHLKPMYLCQLHVPSYNFAFFPFQRYPDFSGN